MLLKRKRSDSALSCISSSLSSPDRPGVVDCTVGITAASDKATRIQLSVPSHLPSRTLKRFRNNRPSETAVHEHTLSLLFSAQRQQPQYWPESEPSTSLPEQAKPQISGQLSLHSFWDLPRPACSLADVRVSPPLVIAHQSTPTNCEDCGMGLCDDEGEMMDGSVEGLSNHNCGACGKMVCFGCSVSNLGQDRRCLVCAERSVWINRWEPVPRAGLCSR